jgi:hypothetical protein
VYNNGYDVTDSVAFKEFSLKMVNTELTMSSHGVRRSNRQKVEDDKLKNQPTPPMMQAKLGHPVQFAFITAS